MFSMDLDLVMQKDPLTGRYSLRSMFAGWIIMVMIPLASVAYAVSGGMLFWTILAFVLPPVVAILQGALGILSYRLHYGDSPMPHTPAHGVVIVNPEDRSEENECGDCIVDVGCSCLGGKRWRRGGLLNEKDKAVVDRAASEPPLRLLVIGDSLAIGVGTTRSCTPMLPETIARTLSKEYGGRAVYWTSHGVAGASAGWVVRELQRGVKHRAAGAKTTRAPSTASRTVLDATTPELELSDSSSEESSLVDMPDSNLDASSTSGSFMEDEELPDGERDPNSQIDYREWRMRMERHKKRFDPQILGPYDVVVVMTGSNDLKAAFFPFLLTGEDAEFQKQARKRGGAYATELRRLLLALSQRMNMKLEVDSGTEKGIKVEDSGKAVTAGSSSLKVNTNARTRRSEAPPTPSNFKRPLLVLPANPANVLPSFQVYPLKWLSVPMVGMTDNAKRDLAKNNPKHVLFVEPPTEPLIGLYEDQTGKLWEQRIREDTLLSLRRVKRSSCERVEGTMESYYGEKMGMYGHQRLFQCEPVPVKQYNPMVPKLSERPGRMGSKIFSIDGVHANDEGYDLWGRLIGDAIVTELRKGEDSS